MYLNCKTYFSFKYGTFSTEELVNTAVEKGATAIALTNINCTCDSWDFVNRCRQAGIKPILGVEIRNGDQFEYILLAANNAGLFWMHEFLSDHIMNKKPFPKAGDPVAFFSHSKDGFVIFPPGAKPIDQLLSNETIGIQPQDITKMYSLDWKRYGEKFVVWQPVTVQNKMYHNLHRLLRAVDKNTLVSKLDESAICGAHETFVAPGEILNAFRQYPFVITNSYKLIDSCNIDMDFATDKNKQTFGGNKEDDRILLEKLASDGFEFRYGKKNKIARERLKKELKIINDLGFNAYFLINYDIIRYAQSRGFYYVGRGSGANSIVAYCLKITDVDPIELNLYFERFLNPERTSPPDFDIDFSWTDRDEIIDYIFKRYGKQKVALLASYPTFQHDAIIRELGKALGLPDEEIKSLQRTNAATDKIGRAIVQYGKLLQNFPSHLSLHPCGMLVLEEPVLTYGALFMPPKGFPTVMLDMFVAEDISINKFDILSQRGLGHIKEALRLIKANKQVSVDIHDIQQFKKDKKIAAQIRTANTVGCFYIESPAMRQLLSKLRCDNYLTLVAASSIIRPGVAQSGMMRTYIQRFHHPETVEYLHPVFKEHLEETFGVMVFQEDVIKTAHYFAGLSLGLADVLRRAMSGKYKFNNKFQQIKDAFMQGCEAMGHSKALAEEVWRQMESFAGYSFNKAHSASYAVESYQSLQLKTYFPREFCVAVINNFGGFYSTELYFLELRKTGAVIHLPCVNNSEYYTSIAGDNVYVGMIHLKALEKKVAETILEERQANGPYLHLQDFIERTHITKEQVNILVSIGAFRYTGKSKKTLLWEANFLQKKNKDHVPAAESLFSEPPITFTLPEFSDNLLDDLYDQMEILGFPLCNPFDLVDDDPAKYTYAKDLHKHLHQIVSVLVYYIDRKVVPTVNNQTMSFGTFLDAELNWIDTVHFPPSFAQYPLESRGFYKITGKVVEDFGVYSVEVQCMFKVGYKTRRYANL